MRDRNDIPEPGKDLGTLLGEAVTDGYHRKRPKRARYRPPNPDKKPSGKPQVRKLTAAERKRLNEIENEMVA